MATKLNLAIFLTTAAFLLSWSLYPAIHHHMVARSMSSEWIQDDLTATKRKIQRELLHKGIYIDVDDIYNPQSFSEDDQNRFKNICASNTRVWVFVPLEIRLSFFGNLVYTMCYGIK